MSAKRPAGILLAGAARQYANRYGVSVGKRIVLATNNDSAYLAALDLVAAGAPVARARLPRRGPAFAKWLRAQGVEVRAGASVAKALGRRRLERIVLHTGEAIDCDALGVSGAGSPPCTMVHARAPVAFEESRRSFRPRDPKPPLQAIGSLNGCTSLDANFAEAIGAIHQGSPTPASPGRADGGAAVVRRRRCPPVAGVRARPRDESGRRWLDFQHDVRWPTRRSRSRRATSTSST